MIHRTVVVSCHFWAFIFSVSHTLFPLSAPESNGQNPESSHCLVLWDNLHSFTLYVSHGWLVERGCPMPWAMPTKKRDSDMRCRSSSTLSRANCWSCKLSSEKWWEIWKRLKMRKVCGNRLALWHHFFNISISDTPRSFETFTSFITFKLSTPSKTMSCRVTRKRTQEILDFKTSWFQNVVSIDYEWL